MLFPSNEVFSDLRFDVFSVCDAIKRKNGEAEAAAMPSVSPMHPPTCHKLASIS